MITKVQLFYLKELGFKMNITINDIKDANPKFFDNGNMRFFGEQKFELVKTNEGILLKIEFLEKCPRVCFYKINENLKITNVVKD